MTACRADRLSPRLAQRLTHGSYRNDLPAVLGATVNWSEFKEDSDGDGTRDLVQQRSCNPVNEITEITTAVGPAWATPAYDRNGNMVTIPKPADPTQAFSATYDAWNRLVNLRDTATGISVAQFRYDGLGRRVGWSGEEGQDDTLAEANRDYSMGWQQLEEHSGASNGSVSRQFAWEPTQPYAAMLRW